MNHFHQFFYQKIFHQLLLAMYDKPVEEIRYISYYKDNETIPYIGNWNDLLNSSEKLLDNICVQEEFIIHGTDWFLKLYGTTEGYYLKLTEIGRKPTNWKSWND